MSQWASADLATNAPEFDCLSGLGASANGNVAFDNVQAGAFVSGVAIGVFGVSAAEVGNTSGEGPHVAHAGWVLRKAGTGGLATVTITAPGKGYANGFLTVTGGGTSNTVANVSYAVQANGSVDGIATGNQGVGYSNGYLTFTGGGTGNVSANASYTVNGTGAIVSIVINDGGSNYDSNPAASAAAGSNATFVITTNTGTIVATTIVSPGSYTGNSPVVTVANANSQATFTATAGGRAGRIQYETLVAMGTIQADSGADDAEFPGP